MKAKRGKHGGFTLFELMVTVGIMGILTTIVVANYRGFEKQTVLDNLALDVSLSVRLAQVYGLNVKGAGGSDPFNTSYGIHLARNQKTQYILFRDANRSVGGFVYGGDSVKVYTLQKNYTISDVCADRTTGTTDCFSGSMSRLDIVFDRPRPDAIFTSNIGGATYERAVITLRSPDGLEKSVEVLSTGYISVQ